jgi:hypothetical protein
VDIHFSEIMVAARNSTAAKRHDGLITCGDAAVIFDLVDESLDQVSLFVEVLAVRDSLRAGTLRWNDGLSTRVCNGGSKVIGVVALVGEQVFEGKTLDQALCLTDIGDLACRQDEADRIAEGIDGNVDLCAQAAARTPDRLIFASPFLAPVATAPLALG